MAAKVEMLRSYDIDPRFALEHPEVLTDAWVAIHNFILAVALVAPPIHVNYS